MTEKEKFLQAIKIARERYPGVFSDFNCERCKFQINNNVFYTEQNPKLTVYFSNLKYYITLGTPGSAQFNTYVTYEEVIKGS